MKKSIVQIIQLSKNPHYKLSPEETEALQQWYQSHRGSDEDESQPTENRKNKKSFKKQTGSFKKHDTEIKE